jgi:antitoxin ParD1/3/4
MNQCRANDDQDALKLEALRMLIKAGIDELERGNFVEIDEAELEDYLERLTPERAKPR